MSLDKIIEIAKWFSFQHCWKNWSILFTQKNWFIFIQQWRLIKFESTILTTTMMMTTKSECISKAVLFEKSNQIKACIKYHFHVIANGVHGNRDYIFDIILWLQVEYFLSSKVQKHKRTRLYRFIVFVMHTFELQVATILHSNDAFISPT